MPEHTKPKHTSKKFHGGERNVPHKSEKASKYYSTEDVKTKKKTRKTPRPTKHRDALKPGRVLILLAGRFRGKRVVLLKAMDQGILLVTGPFKVNGVPIRRVNSRYVITTTTEVDLNGVDSALLDKVSDSKYWTADKSANKKGEEAFFKQGEKPEKKEVSSERKEDQQSLDQSILVAVKKTPMLKDYLASSFSLRNGDKPHEMRF